MEGREPDPVPRCDHWSLTAVTVCAGFLVQHGALKVDMGGVPCFLRAPEPVVHRRSLGLTLMPRSQNRLIPQYTLERRELVEEWRSEFWAISAQSTNIAHSPGQSRQKDLRNLPTSWLTLFTCPILSG